MARLAVAGTAALVALAGCGSSDPPETPAACLGASSAYVEALRSAPGEVRLADGTPISACLVDEQGAGALQTVGKSLVDAAIELNREGLRSRDAQTLTELGYLVGAVERGAAGTAGIHRDLVLRVDSAAAFRGAAARPLSAALERAYERGRDAGLETG